MENKKVFRNLIKDICDELNIKYTILSKDWIIMLEKENTTRFISGYKFDLATHGLGVLLDDKYAMYEVLSSKNIPIIKHYIIYASNNKNDYAKDCNSYKYLEYLFNKYNNNIVLKINNGSCGIGVYNITNKELLKNKYDNLTISNFSLSVCPYYDISNEFRVVILDDNIKLLYKKIKPKVIGNGNLTIKKLLIEFNEKYFKDYNGDNKDVVLKAGEEYEYDWKFNLSRGAISSLDILNQDKEKIYSIVNKIKLAVNIRFGSIDIIKTVDDSFYVMEINSGVMMDKFIIQNKDGYKIAKEIYKEAINKMFE